MTPQEIVETICAEFAGVAPKSSWGETALFYNPGRQLPNGVYFCTIKEKDGANDKASQLDRPGVFRVAIGLGPEKYRELFGARPSRPPKGGIVATGHDFTQLNQLIPHPIYAWMSWAQILSPSAEEFARLLPHIRGAYEIAVQKFARKVGKS